MDSIRNCHRKCSQTQQDDSNPSCSNPNYFQTSNKDCKKYCKCKNRCTNNHNSLHPKLADNIFSIVLNTHNPRHNIHCNNCWSHRCSHLHHSSSPYNLLHHYNHNRCKILNYSNHLMDHNTHHQTELEH